MASVPVSVLYVNRRLRQYSSHPLGHICLASFNGNFHSPFIQVDPDFDNEIDGANADRRRIRWRVLDDQLVDIRHIPPDSSCSSSSLLMFNPPVPSLTADGDDLTKGHLRPPPTRTRLDCRGSLDQNQRLNGSARSTASGEHGKFVDHKWHAAMEGISGKLGLSSAFNIILE